MFLWSDYRWCADSLASERTVWTHLLYHPEGIFNGGLVTAECQLRDSSKRPVNQQRNGCFFCSLQGQMLTSGRDVWTALKGTGFVCSNQTRRVFVVIRSLHTVGVTSFSFRCCAPQAHCGCRRSLSLAASSKESRITAR